VHTLIAPPPFPDSCSLCRCLFFATGKGKGKRKRGGKPAAGNKKQKTTLAQMAAKGAAAAAAAADAHSVAGSLAEKQKVGCCLLHSK
jgi:hypothetical protein